ncbi:MAG: glucose-6-phosphate dehydrogenase, partial [Desulfohalobiaceae bacterium]|nr:glucose-6-phosphate dehydrogenase [Desulfohalobiaceae bacterium]
MPNESTPRAEVIPQGPEPDQSCQLEKTNEPVTMVIFGATGDLTCRKLFPALYSLFQNALLPENFIIVGASRSELDHDAFREKMKQCLTDELREKEFSWPNMAARLFYRQVRFDSLESFVDLAGYLSLLEGQFSLQGNKLFYLAVPPSAYEDIACNLGRAGLAREEANWSRFVVEKPFGRDLDSAKQLDHSLHEHFAEHQIFRIDHYLAKETVQNILMLRFANSIFEPVWDRRYIDYVRITAAEDIGVEHRAGYYDHYGVLRDMFQNHMMQLLALCAMEPPSIFEADRVRDEKTKLYRSLRPFPVETLNDHLVLGQYSSGVVKGEKVASYLDEPEVAPDSLTPTYAAMRIFVDNWRWQGVPFYLVSGKRLAEKRTEIAVQFKQVPFSMFRGVLGGDISANRLILGIQPREEVDLTFQTKVPGPRVCLRSVTMHFNYNQGIREYNPDAYA